ncbi:MAG: insulinase family protein, partial [Bacteroidales bacterium]|nr:insulinase family protein [Bacteroidales bacterium]
MLFLGLFISINTLAQKYETVENDPMKTRIYTLQNGLKVYMSVDKSEPRIQTYIAVRVGSKNDPKETTGLAHYFEHMMFKGTSNFGTTNWAEEQKYITQIENLYEVYRQETDKEKRNALYKQIDSLSYIASGFAIANEYDKMMSFIGSKGTNAATSNDYTFYQENIPSNQLENWAKIQADRFSNPVLRLFHTELETIYEEKNMSLTNEARKVREEMLKALFPSHPYGQQTTLGEAEHLRNPSLKNIREFHAKYYVPNNYCIAMSGDFDPD